MNTISLFPVRDIFFGLVCLGTMFLCGCGTDSDDEENYCGLLSRSYSMRNSEIPGLNTGCNNISISYSNYSYDQYGRTISCQFSITCRDQGKIYSGRFDNVVYNSLGQIQSYDATVNGQNCHYTRK
jgi:hypothetical protein